MSGDDFITKDNKTEEESEASIGEQAEEAENPPAEDAPDLPYEYNEFLGTASPYRAASYSRDEISKILGKSVSKKTTNYMNAAARDSKKEVL